MTDMVAPVIIVLCGLMAPVICNTATYVYSDDCQPPSVGFNNSEGVSGCVGCTTTVAPYESMLPIERCCPQCDECKHYAGSCILKWAGELYPQCCDFSPVQPCKDYSCQCCIRCSDDTCSPCVQTDGECRTECRSGELEDKSNLCAYHNDGAGCKCCKRCESTVECSEAEGTCVTNPEDCHHGTFASTGCCGGCYCCKPVQTIITGSNCELTTGCYCNEVPECASGYYACYGECSKTVFNKGLKTTILGYGCIPKAIAGPAVPGRRTARYHPRHLLLD